MTKQNQTIVKINSGKLEGNYQDGLYVFKGIPYAAPPVGELRWLPPQPVKRWKGVRQAKVFGTVPLQNPMIGGPIVMEPEPQNEDCLFLNIYTPGLDDARRPVMFWIHGGGFTLGSGSSPMYNGKLTAVGGVVTVTINYRLGVLGFLNLKEITNGRIPAIGNEGLLDQIAALKWARENITAFGGDPENITVFGESAGAMSIGCLLAMPLAQGLFHKAILESGTGCTAIPLAQAVETSKRFIKILGVDPADTRTLRSLKPEKLLEAEMKLRQMDVRPGEQARITATSPVIDGEIIPGVPTQVVQNSPPKNIQMIIGTNLEEWKPFAVMMTGRDKLLKEDIIGQLTRFMDQRFAESIVNQYFNIREKRGDDTKPGEVMTALETDLMFRIPALRLVEVLNDKHQPVYHYLFTYKTPVMGGVLGACHGLELGFVFGILDDMMTGTGPAVEKLSRCIQDSWVSFARTGNPSCDSIGDWPVYGERRMTMVLDKECRVEADPYSEERRAWDTIPDIDSIRL